MNLSEITSFITAAGITGNVFLSIYNAVKARKRDAKIAEVHDLVNSMQADKTQADKENSFNAGVASTKETL